MQSSIYSNHCAISAGRKPESRQLLVLGGQRWASDAVGDTLSGRAECVVPVESIDNALNYLREQPVDIVLIQANTPLCAKSVEAIVAEFDVPVVAVGSDDSVDAALVAGATDFIVEPFSRQVLIRRLDFVLETANVPVEEPLSWPELKHGAAHHSLAGVPAPVGVATAHWELDTANGELTWSPSIARVVDPETAARCCTLSGFMSLVDATDLPIFQRSLQKLADGEGSEIKLQISLQGAHGQSYRLSLDGEGLADEFIFGTMTRVAEKESGLFNGVVADDLDAETQLPKQAYFLHRLSAMMDRLVTGVTAVLTLDLGGVSRINGHFGPEVGVSLQLAAIARLREILPPESVVALLCDSRIGVALENVASTNAVDRLANQLVARLAENYFYDEQPLHIQPTLGVSVSSSDANEASELLTCSLTALEQANNDTAVQFYADRARVKRHDNRLEICTEAYLFNALDNGELEVYYQPQVDTVAKKIIGMEALLRWTNPQLGRVSPMLFIPIAEKAGLIDSIGAWVIQEAARQMSAWRALGLGSIRVGINLSPKQLLNDNVEQQLRAVSRQFDVSPSQFDLEVTETVAIDEASDLSQRLSRMREMGASISLDDFGTRHSALSHLQDLDVDCLKIDRQFVSSIGGERSTALTDAIVILAKTLQKKVIAEGVETLEQLRYLQQRGCDCVQGFYFSEPVNAEKATKLLEQGYDGLAKRDVATPTTGETKLKKVG